MLFYDPGAASLHGRSAVRIIIVDSGTFVVYSFPHSVDHTGDGRNEEAESLFMLYAILFNELSGSGISGYVTS